MEFIKKISYQAWSALFLLLGLFLLFTSDTLAQSSWDQCTDGTNVVRCETYDCPNGDTNQDGSCSLADTGARLSDVRNDSFCANPLSGCGEVRYYPAQSSQSCQVRVEENVNNCNLYDTQTPDTSAQDEDSELGSLTCSTLSVSPSSGAAPLSVRMRVSSTGDLTQVDSYRFKITGPNSAASGEIEQNTNILNQTLSLSGTYTISASIVDDSGEAITSSACSRTIVVGAAAIGGGGDSETGSSNQLPETGFALNVGLLLVVSGALGIFMFDRFKLA